MNHKPPKKSLLPQGNSKTTRLIIVAGGGLVLVILVIVFMSVLSANGDKTNEKLSALVVQQAEIARIADLGAKSASDSTVKDLAINTSLGLTSDQASTVAYLKNHGTSVSEKQIATGEDSKTDAALTQAKQAGLFDSTFKQILTTKLTTYRQDVKSAYDGTSNKKTKQLLNTEYQHASTLLGN